MQRAAARTETAIRDGTGTLRSPALFGHAVSTLGPATRLLLLTTYLLAAFGILCASAVAEPASIYTLDDLDDAPGARLSRDKSLVNLLAVPVPDYVWDTDSTDSDLAAAVDAGNDPDLEKRNPFRKRKFDLFRTERQLEIGQAEMLLRLRVRAKMRKAVSFELHF